MWKPTISFIGSGVSIKGTSKYLLNVNVLEKQLENLQFSCSKEIVKFFETDNFETWSFQF